MGHKWFTYFDRSVCDGETQDVEGECPLKQGGMIDRCGACGCTLIGLDMADAPPDNCPRLDAHEAAGEREGNAG